MNSNKAPLLRLMVPWLILIPLLTVLFYSYFKTQTLEPLKLAGHTSLQNAVQSIARNTANFRQDAGYLARQAALHLDPISPQPCAKSISQLFRQFAEASGLYLQIRWLDNRGHECLRIDWDQDQARMISPNELQDKSGRYYVQEGLKLAQGDFYFSRLDLNKEHGEIQRPFVPTLRIVVAVFDSHQQRQGIIVLNAKAIQMLQDLRIIADNYSLLDVHLLNADGYWIVSPNPDDSWGFMLNQAQLKFPVRFPGAWQRISGNDNGQFIDDHGMWSYQTIQASQDSKRAWKIITHTPQSEIDDRLQWPLAGALFFGAALLLLSLWINFRTVKARQALQESNDTLTRQQLELRQYAKALQSSMEHLESTQAELVETGKLSSLGMMVAGVAHELNTPLGSALVTLSCLDSDTEQLRRAFQHGLKRSDMEHFFQRVDEGTTLIERNLKRSAELVKSFKQLAVDRKTEERRTFAIKDLIEDLQLTAWSSYRKQKDLLNFEIADDIPELDSYPGAMGQVIENLVSNAIIHGFTDGSFGQITVTAKAHNDQLCISICDNGVGISKANLKKIFDPFFTTRRSEGGTGLGLHLVHQLVTQVLGGKILVDSTLNQGTCFMLTLPVKAPTLEPTETLEAEVQS